MRDLANAVGGGKFADRMGKIGGASLGEELPSLVAFSVEKFGLVGDRAEMGERGDVEGPSRGLTGVTVRVIESPLGLLMTLRAAALVFFGVVGVVATFRGLGTQR